MAKGRRDGGDGADAVDGQRCRACGASVGLGLEGVQERVRDTLAMIEKLPEYQAAQDAESAEVAVAALLADALAILDPVVHARRVLRECEDDGEVEDSGAGVTAPGRRKVR